MYFLLPHKKHAPLSVWPLTDPEEPPHCWHSEPGFPHISQMGNLAETHKKKLSKRTLSQVVMCSSVSCCFN